MTNNKTTIIAEPDRQEIIITREFDAPRELVFAAYTDPKIYVQWLGPRRLAMTIDKFEPVTGGSWRYIHKDETGTEFAFHGVFHEVSSPLKIISTFEFEGLPARQSGGPETGHVTLDTTTFEALPDGRTKLTTQSVFQSVEDRDGTLRSGMERGINDSYSRLDEVLERINKK